MQTEKNIIRDNVVHIVIVSLLALISFYVVFYYRLYYGNTKISVQIFNDYMDLILEKYKHLNEVISDISNYSGNMKNIIKETFIIFGISGVLYLYIVSTLFRKSDWHKKEKGSSKFGNDKDRVKYNLHQEFIEDKKTKERINNLILSNTEFLPVNTRIIHRNLNTLILGGSGAGKTRWFVKPNICQANTNFVITDPKGELHRTTSKYLEAQGYTIKVLNLVEPEFSHTYNPFNYVSNETDITILADCIIKNTEGKNSKGDAFWVRAETALLKALMYFVYYECSHKEKNMKTVLQMITTSQEKQDEDSMLTQTFNKLRGREPDHIACQFYHGIFLQAPYETKMSILISLAVRIQTFGVPEINKLTCTDTINIDNCNSKMATYVIIPDSHTAYNVIAAMFFTQSFQRLYYLADTKYGGALPIHTQFMLDEFANLGAIPSFPKLISTMRGRAISVMAIVQSTAQLEQLYEKDAETIIGNCDTTIYLGGNDTKTAKMISEKIGKTTIQVYQLSIQKGRNASATQGENISARELMMTEELLRLDDTKCIVLVRGFYPFFSDKYNLERHPAYHAIENLQYHTTAFARFHVNKTNSIVSTVGGADIA